MVDQEARRQYGQLIRQFASGRMTNREYEEKYEAMPADRSDAAIREISLEIWLLYDDNYTHRMTGSHRLNAESRRAVARAVLFLQSGRDYGWPPSHLWGCLLFFLLTADFWATVSAVDRWPDVALLAVTVGAAAGVPLAVCWAVLYTSLKHRWNAAGDADAWSFLRRADLAEAVRQPRLLNGANRKRPQP